MDKPKTVLSYCKLCGSELTERMMFNAEIWGVYFPHSSQGIYDVCEHCFCECKEIVEAKDTIYKDNGFSDFVYIGTKMLK